MCFVTRPSWFMKIWIKSWNIHIVTVFHWLMINVITTNPQLLHEAVIQWSESRQMWEELQVQFSGKNWTFWTNLEQQRNSVPFRGANFKCWVLKSCKDSFDSCPEDRTDLRSTSASGVTRVRAEPGTQTWPTTGKAPKEPTLSRLSGSLKQGYLFRPQRVCCRPTNDMHCCSAHTLTSYDPHQSSPMPAETHKWSTYRVQQSLGDTNSCNDRKTAEGKQLS